VAEDPAKRFADDFRVLTRNHRRQRLGLRVQMSLFKHSPLNARQKHRARDEEKFGQGSEQVV
jgi:hypothetical protein